MDARQLEYFLAIVDHGGFGRAAERLLIAQPSLSQAIAQLERDLGVQLFHRTGRGAVLSDAGRELIGPARQVIRDLSTARAAMESLKGLRRGRVELVTMPSPGIEPLGTLSRMFSERHPGVTLSAEAAFTPDEVAQKVISGASELGLVGSAGWSPHPGVDVLPLEEQEFVLVGAGAGPFPHGDPVAPEALVDARMIVSPRGSLMRQIVDDMLAAGIALHIVAEVAHRTSILPLVLRDIGLAVLPAAWAPLARSAGARVVPLDLPARLHIALVSRAAPLSPAAAAFLATARDYTPPAHAAAEGEQRS
ncbi:LysR family transcriptional regulator [Actinomadura darangshiensis]|uniref:LysR family transcriptional regulator n=1 Tax=Actinomadura darangshiensis TaxID=705336 RepID=A0A4R5B4H3_9ACTN|nr:LysR substrate-binding domain-containing protein [Actinomadura darangshiensis]TDD80135.1 LysR family transcriptional regulator [Actinomadura darangshiensis]